jgi:YggT family protein
MQLFIQVIHYVVLIFSWVLIAYVVLSYFMDPYHPIRLMLSRIIEPLLTPIRRILPRTGTIDFSPFVLLILIQVVEFILLRVAFSLR